jgi:sRNA-binding carbon storage regulator CsrA
VPVFRKEVYLEIQDEHREAVKPEDVVAEVDAALQGLGEPPADKQ